MSFRICVDSGFKCVVVEFVGEVTDDDVTGSATALFQHPDHDPSYHRLIDARRVTKVSATGDAVREVARRWAPLITGRAALLANSDAAFAMMRMYELYVDDPRVRVFRKRAEAIRWLKE